MGSKQFSDKARTLIVLLIGIIIGGFAYFVADNITASQLGQNSVFRFRSYKVQEVKAPVKSDLNVDYKSLDTNLNYAKPFPDGN